MLGASKLPERYGIGKTLFYQRRNYLLKLGYDLEPEKDGNKRKYRDEQIQLLDELNKYIRQNGGMEGFPCATVRDESGLVHTDSEQTERKRSHSSEGFSEATIGRESGLVRSKSEQTGIEREQTQKISVNTAPIADIKEHQLKSVDGAAQYSAAELLAVFNYRPGGVTRKAKE